MDRMACMSAGASWGSPLNTSKYLPRFRFTAAHEAAHHVFGHQVAVDQDVGQTGGDPQERAANSFAAAFLVLEKAWESEPN